MENRRKGPKTPPEPPEKAPEIESSNGVQDIAPFAGALKVQRTATGLQRSDHLSPSSPVAEELSFYRPQLPLRCSECDTNISSIQLVRNPDNGNDLRIVCNTCQRISIQGVMETKTIESRPSPSFRSPNKRPRMDDSLEHFGNYVLSTLREMSPRKNRNMQRELINVLLSKPIDEN